MHVLITSDNIARTRTGFQHERKAIPEAFKSDSLQQD